MEILNCSSSFHQIRKLIAKLCIFTWHNLSSFMMVFDVHTEPINKFQFISFFLGVPSFLHLMQWNNRCQWLSHGTCVTSCGLRRQGFFWGESLAEFADELSFAAYYHYSLLTESCCCCMCSWPFSFLLSSPKSKINTRSFQKNLFQ